MPDSIQNRKCHSCKIPKLLSDFYNATSRKDKKSTECIRCTKERVKKWAKNNPEKRRVSVAKWVKENKKAHDAYKADWRRNNPEKWNGYRKKWVLNNPEKDRNRRLVYSTGITLDQYEIMLKNQNGVCAICNHVSKDGRQLCVDHCHKTGKIRGLLCSACNTTLGFMEDDVKRLFSAIKYLKQ